MANSKKRTIPVYIREDGHLILKGWATRKMTKGEIAGKFLPDRSGDKLWRRVISKSGVYGLMYIAEYFEPTPAQQEEWENRPVGISEDEQAAKAKGKHLRSITQPMFAH